jgi:hypothetical protein
MDEISGALSTESFTKSTGTNNAKSIYMHMSKDMRDANIYCVPVQHTGP